MEDTETPCIPRETTYDLNCDGKCILRCLQLATCISGHFNFVSQDVYWATINYGQRTEIWFLYPSNLLPPV
jgi:hypothetical protein